MKKLKYIEALSFITSWHDLSYEYTGENELKMLRANYIFHALNTVLRQNELILANDLKGKIFHNFLDKEENDQEYKLKKMVEAELDDESESENEKEEPQEQESTIESPFVIKSDKVRFDGIEEAKDQGFTRPKVLILTGYKKMAYYIVNEIITQFNYGSWKKVIKKKRFKQEFDLNSEEAVND